MITVNKERLITAMEKQASIGNTGRADELNRPAPSDEMKDVYDWFITQLEDAGLAVRVDEIGNVFGRREGANPDLSPILVGSHLDSHRYGGIYDGALGVISALETVRTLNDEGIGTNRPIEVVSWFNEEGNRYAPGLMGSKVWAGLMDLESAYSQVDENGVKLEDELERVGYKGDTPATPQSEYKTYFELHIEQGPFLREKEVDVGVVTGIIGITNGEITLYGQADHSGGTQMYHREDALIGAADVITQVRRIANTLGERTVGTVGKLTVEPNNRNAIPGKVEFTWEFRDPSDEIVEAAYQRVLEEVESAAEREGLAWEASEKHRTKSVNFGDSFLEPTERAVEELGYDGTQIFSGGGHDAQIVQNICDAGMVFAVNDSGRSHTAEEETSWKNCYKAANTLANGVLNAAGEVSK